MIGAIETQRLFGFLPLRLELSGSTFAICTLDTFDQAVDRISRSSLTWDGWLWPPPRRPGATAPKPIFGVPMTHALQVSGVSHEESDSLGEFLIAVVGLLHGIVLIPEGWVHLARVNLDPTGANDYILVDSARLRVLECAAAFWRAQPAHRETMRGILYWHCVSTAFQHDHERFGWRYSVLDACWNLHAKLKSVNAKTKHSERIAALAAEYQLDLPPAWDGGKIVVHARNELVHEARWKGRPIGFLSDQGRASKSMSSRANLPSTIFWFNTRLILAMLGDSSDYVRSRIRGVDLLFD